MIFSQLSFKPQLRLSLAELSPIILSTTLRLLKGACPGRKQVNYFASEIGVLKNNKLFAERCQYDHLVDVLAGQFDFSKNHSGMGGITSDEKFYDPEKVKDYTGSIRFKDPQRSVPVLA